MVHPGLPVSGVTSLVFIMLALSLWYSIRLKMPQDQKQGFYYSLKNRFVLSLVTQPYVLITLKLFSAAVFLLVIYAGLFGTPVPERNIATVLTWTIWWSGVVLSVFFVGSAWCAICPWDALANWLVKWKLWRRGNEQNSLNLRVPKVLRSVWPALMMFVVLTWLELGAGITVSPYATALLSLLMVILATVSLLVYERKAFCRYFCAVGRTLGAYSAMAPIALRPIDSDVCKSCDTLACYNGTPEVEPCPTHLVMGSLKQNTYCISCGACSVDCTYQNVSWQLRGVGSEVTNLSRKAAMRARVDEAVFILGLVSLTTFHGLTMMPYWESSIRSLARYIGDSGQLLGSFSIAMFVSILIPILMYFVTVKLTQKLLHLKEDFKRVFSALAVSILPLAFTYHIAHNLTHLVRESRGFWGVVANPLGIDTNPLTMMERHTRHLNPLIPDDVTFALQGLLILFGFWLALHFARQRVQQLSAGENISVMAFVPVLLFVASISLADLWLLMQPMVMRM